MEYFPDYFDEMLKNVISLGGEYLILGQHFINNGHPEGIYTYEKTECVDYLKQYVSEITDAMKHGVFTYVAHPDIINFAGNILVYTEEMRKICIASRKENVPLEINFLGIRGKRKYPNEVFWKIAGEEKAPVTFGFDAHDVKSAFDEESLKTAKKMVKMYNLNYIGKPKLHYLKNM